jgi:hypothetical protein
LYIVPTIRFLYRLFIRVAGLMNKVQVFFVFEMFQRFYNRRIYSVGPLTAADDQYCKKPVAAIVALNFGMTIGIF